MGDNEKNRVREREEMVFITYDIDFNFKISTSLLLFKRSLFLRDT